jgi:hypothetical protein
MVGVSDAMLMGAGCCSWLRKKRRLRVGGENDVVALDIGLDIFAVAIAIVVVQK